MLLSMRHTLICAGLSLGLLSTAYAGQVETRGLRFPRVRFLFQIHCRHKSLRMMQWPVEGCGQASQSILPLRKRGKRG